MGLIDDVQKWTDDPVVKLAAELILLAIKYVGPERAKALLDQAAVDRANAVADEIEKLRGLT